MPKFRSFMASRTTATHASSSSWSDDALSQARNLPRRDAAPLRNWMSASVSSRAPRASLSGCQATSSLSDVAAAAATCWAISATKASAADTLSESSRCALNFSWMPTRSVSTARAPGTASATLSAMPNADARRSARPVSSAKDLAASRASSAAPRAPSRRAPASPTFSAVFVAGRPAPSFAARAASPAGEDGVADGPAAPASTSTSVSPSVSESRTRRFGSVRLAMRAPSCPPVTKRNAPGTPASGSSGSSRSASMMARASSRVASTGSAAE